MQYLVDIFDFFTWTTEENNSVASTETLLTNKGQCLAM